MTKLPPQLERAAPIPVGSVFGFGGRPLVVVKVCGDDAAAPVIVEELANGPSWLKGQFGLWSAAGVMSALQA